MAAGALLASLAGVALWTSPAFTSHRVCSVNGLNSIFLSTTSASSNAVDINVECNNQDLRTRTGPEIQGTSAVEANAPGFDPSQLLAFAALDRCIGPLTGAANLESGLPGSTSPNGVNAVNNCQTQGGVLIHGPFSALGPGAVTNNMFGRVITMNGFDAVSFLKTDGGDAMAFGNQQSADVLAMQGIIVPCTNPLQSLGTGLFTCDFNQLGGDTTKAMARDANGALMSNVNLASFNMAPNTSSAFTAGVANTVGTGGNTFLVSTTNDFQFVNAGGTAPTASSICGNVVTLDNGAEGPGAATNLASITTRITVNTGVSCGVQRITQNVPNATGVEDPTGPGAVNGAGGGVSLVSMVFSFFAQQQLGNLDLLSQAGDITIANTAPRVNFVQLISQGLFTMDASGFFRYNQGGTTFPVASYPTGRTMSLSSVISGPNVGDPSACIPATTTNTCAP